MDCEISVLPSIVSIGKLTVNPKFGLSILLGIHDNIEAFGGDPENVVAVGQSVGAMAIGLHLVSYAGTEGVPFQKAM